MFNLIQFIFLYNCALLVRPVCIKGWSVYLIYFHLILSHLNYDNLFLQQTDNALSGCGDIDAEPAGHHSFLSFEQSDSLMGLPIMKYDQKRVTATASWDSSVHDSVYLNRVTPNTERVYIILKVRTLPSRLFYVLF